MILVWLILLPLIGGLLCWAIARTSPHASRWTAAGTMVIELVFACFLWLQYWRLLAEPGAFPWLMPLSIPWIPQIGATFLLTLDGISLPLIVLTAFLGTLAVFASWRGITQRIGFFHFCLLWSFSGIIGVFLAFDLFLFYFFWELMLIPLFFLIDIWGLEQRHQAAMKFLLFTQIGGLFLLLGILGLYFAHGLTTGEYTFAYSRLLGTRMSPVAGFWLMLSFFVAFAVKLPVVPVHTWLPDAHTQAPTAGSVDLAGLVLKVGAYGMMRFLVPLFPAAALALTPIAMTIGVVSILYGSVLAFAQSDIKRLVGYSSISHMGFALMGIFAWNTLALQGVMIILIAHGLITGALFILIGALQHRRHTREMDALSGSWSLMPRLSGSGLFLAVGLLGLPGMGSFVGEFLVLLGVYQVSPLFAVLGSVGFIVVAVYTLRMVQRVFFGTSPVAIPPEDLLPREMAMMGGAILATLWIGFFPQTLLDTTAPAVRQLQQIGHEVSPPRSERQRSPVSMYTPAIHVERKGADA